MDQLVPADHSRVVVGVDGSLPSQLALTWGRFLAQAMGGVVEAVTAWEDPVSWVGLPQDWDPAAEARSRLLATCATVFGNDVPSDVQIVTRQGAPASVLITASRKARLLVVGSRGHGGVAGLLLGSVSAAVAEHAACPTLIIHESDKTPESLTPDEDPMADIQHTEHAHVHSDVCGHTAFPHGDHTDYAHDGHWDDH